MRDETIYQHLRGLGQAIQTVNNSVQVALTGETLHIQALQNLLIKKGVITEIEFKESLSELIKEINTKAEKKQKKPEIVKPTQEQVQTVIEQSKKD